MQHIRDLVKDIPPPETGDRYDVPPISTDCDVCKDAKVVKSKGEIVRCPQCAPNTRELLLKGCEPVSWVDWQHSPATNDAVSAINLLLSGEKWCVFLRGKWGIGKTMLAKIAAWEFTERGQGALFVNVPDFLASLKETFDDDNRNTSQQTYAYVFESYAMAPFLVLDDLGKEYATAWARSEMYRIIDRRYAKKLPLVVTSNIEFGDDFEPAIRSRLGPGEVVIKGVGDQRPLYEG